MTAFKLISSLSLLLILSTTGCFNLITEDESAYLTEHDALTYPAHDVEIHLHSTLLDEHRATIASATVDRPDIASVSLSDEDTALIQGVSPGTTTLTILDNEGQTHTVTINVEVPKMRLEILPVINYSIHANEIPALLIFPEAPITLQTVFFNSKGEDITHEYTPPESVDLKLETLNPTETTHTALTHEDTHRWTLHTGAEIESLSLLHNGEEILPVEVVPLERIHSASLVFTHDLSPNPTNTTHTSPPEHAAEFVVDTVAVAHIAAYDEQGTYIVGDGGQTPVFKAQNDAILVKYQATDLADFEEDERSEEFARGFSHGRAAYVAFEKEEASTLSVDWIIDIDAAVTVTPK